MVSYRIVQLLFFVSSMTSQVLGMMPQGISPEPPKRVSSLPFKVEGIAQSIEGLPKELQYKIFSPALALRENPKYEIYKKFNIGSEVRGIALNADNSRILTGSIDGIPRLWDVEKGTVLKELKGHISHITSVALSADGSIALTGGQDGTARVWNGNTGKLLKILYADSVVYSVALSTDGNTALIGSYESARLYNTNTGGFLRELKGHTGFIKSVALSADGQIALTGSNDGTARVWNTNTGGLLNTLQIGTPVTSAALSADGTLALIGSTFGKVLVWDVKSGALLRTLLSDYPYIYSVALSKDGKRTLIPSGNKIQVWNTRLSPGQKGTNTPLAVLEGHANGVTVVAFGSADSIASGSYDGTIIIWKPYALELQEPLEHAEILRQAYKETFSRPILRSTNKS